MTNTDADRIAALEREVADLRQRATNAETRALRLEQDVRELRMRTDPVVLQPTVNPLPVVTIGDPPPFTATPWPMSTWQSRTCFASAPINMGALSAGVPLTGRIEQ